jgi:hypothetical protein
MPAYDETDIATLLRLLRPAPESWVEAAKELPRTKREIEEVLPLIESEAELRGATTRELEEALRRAGLEPRPGHMAAMRRRFAAEDRGN